MFPAHADSSIRDHESVTLEFSPGPHPATVPLVPALAPIIPAAVGYAIDHVASALDNEAGLYTASYGATIALVSRVVDGKRVLVDPGTKQYSSTANLTLKRATGINNNESSAFVFTMDGAGGAGAVRVTLDSIALWRVRAKVYDGSWSSGWYTRIPFLFGFATDLMALLGSDGYGDNAIDINVTMAVDADTVSKDSAAVTKQRIANLEWVMQNQQFGHDTAVVSKNAVGGWIPSIPEGSTLSITVTVVESDDFGKFVGKASEVLKKNRDKLVDMTQPK